MINGQILAGKRIGSEPSEHFREPSMVGVLRGMREFVGLMTQRRRIGNIPPLTIGSQNAHNRHTPVVRDRRRNGTHPRLGCIDRFDGQRVGAMLDQFMPFAGSSELAGLRVAG